MSTTAFVALVSVVASLSIAQAVQSASVDEENPVQVLAQPVAVIGFLIVAVTVMPMFALNGLLSVEPSVLLSTQAGVLLAAYLSLG